MTSITGAPSITSGFSLPTFAEEAQTFLKTIDLQIDTFNRELGHLRATPDAIVAMVWRKVTAQAASTSSNDVASTSTAPTTDPLADSKNALLEQFALIATLIHGKESNQVNPCGSGKIASLLQYAALCLPALDLFAGQFTSLPTSEAVINELLADFAREVNQWLKQKPEDDADESPDNVSPRSNASATSDQDMQDIKSYLQGIFVTQQQKMNDATFGQLFNRYEAAIRGPSPNRR